MILLLLFYYYFCFGLFITLLYLIVTALISTHDIRMDCPGTTPSPDVQTTEASTESPESIINSTTSYISPNATTEIKGMKNRVTLKIERTNGMGIQTLTIFTMRI